MRLYHFIDRKFGLDDIKRRRLKIATLMDLNDPFELRAVSLPLPEHRRAFDHFREEFAARFGMICFSRVWSSPVQWSHYGERHFGLCMGFDAPDDLFVSVKYQRHLHGEDLIAAVEDGDEAVANQAIMNLLTTKFSHWRYEQEVRGFVQLEDRDPENGMYFHDFGPNLHLREVIVGHRSTVTRSELAEAIGSLRAEVECKKARLAFKTFNVVRQKKASLWK